jgi:hypothetical protein
MLGLYERPSWRGGWLRARIGKRDGRRTREESQRALVCCPQRYLWPSFLSLYSSQPAPQPTGSRKTGSRHASPTVATSQMEKQEEGNEGAERPRPRPEAQPLALPCPTTITSPSRASFRRSAAATATSPPPRAPPQTRTKQQEMRQLNKTRSAAPQIRAPRQAASPPRLLPPPQHCWLRCRSGSGGSAPTLAAARACAAAASSPPSAQEFSTRQSRSQSISLRMTGKMTGKCRTAGDSAKSFQHPASGSSLYVVPSVLVGSSLYSLKS